MQYPNCSHVYMWLSMLIMYMYIYIYMYINVHLLIICSLASEWYVIVICIPRPCIVMALLSTIDKYILMLQPTICSCLLQWLNCIKFKSFVYCLLVFICSRGFLLQNYKAYIILLHFHYFLVISPWKGISSSFEQF